MVQGNLHLAFTVTGVLPRTARSASTHLFPNRFAPTNYTQQLPVARRCHVVASAGTTAKTQKALILDCDGVILESEELHRITYNQCWAEAELGFEWSHEFYEMLQNTVGGGKEKMRWYFARYGWPDGHPSATSEEQEAFIAHLHARKTEMYKALIAEGKAGARPGVLRLIDEAHDHGVRLAICSAANASSVSFVLDRLIGAERLKKFEFVLAGDVVSKKKPDPMIYNVARERLGVAVEDCVVIEDSQIGLEAGLAAGMKVIITHTPYTASQSFEGAASVYPNLGEPGKDTEFVSVDTLFPGVFSVSTV